jgi:phosphoglycolate phosphatase
MQRLIFDLDGTISDPSVGIGRSINHALGAFGFPEIGEQEVSRYIGLPLDAIFRRITPGASAATILDLVARYRERYGEVGYAENLVYPGIPEALQHLASHGVRMGICTSKRVDFAERILALFQLRSYFAFVSAGDIGVRKDEQLRTLVEHGTVRQGAAMIGDRAVDMTAARANGLRSIGVLWGHGSREELMGAVPDQLLESPVELKGLAGAVEAGDSLEAFIDDLPIPRGAREVRRRVRSCGRRSP